MMLDDDIEIKNERETLYTINGRDFTGDQFTALITPRPAERTSDHVCRLALALGVGMVAVLAVGRQVKPPPVPAVKRLNSNPPPDDDDSYDPMAGEAFVG